MAEGMFTRENATDRIGTSPSSLKNHQVGTDLVFTAVSIDDLKNLFSTKQFSFEELEREFAKIIPDYSHEISGENKTFALGFANLVVYTIGPDSRAVKKPGNRKVWKLRITIPGARSGDASDVRYIFISTPSMSETVKPTANYGKICLTITQASLLALKVLSDCVPILLEQNSIILTPVAKAIFSKDDIDDILKDVNLTGELIINKAHLLQMIIQSCQSGGHCLVHSHASCAVAAAVCITQNMINVGVRHSIIAKTYKQYTGVGKPFSRRLYKVFVKYATGDVPAEFAPDSICKIKDEVKQLTIAAKSETYLTQMSQRVSALNLHGGGSNDSGGDSGGSEPGPGPSTGAVPKENTASKN